ncbi:hypothetical protein QBC44DRAFT_329846 [Cladorrhinum sp. PSN332]|nr:hypothetical protein QBC44DRAFT_329846 [Cladorrhinum sp. PSN332]
MSFADRLAEQQRMLRSPVSFSAIAEVDSPDHRLRSQSHPPPPHPFPNNDNQGNDSSPYSSPSRRLKRPSNEISAEQETATRKLVKKLRRTDSRVSTASAAAAAAAATAPAPVHVPAPSRVSIVSVPPALEDLFRPSRPSISSSSIRLVEPSLYGGRSPPPSPTRPSLLRSKLSFAKLTKAMPGPKDPKDAKEKSRRARSVFGFPLVGLGRKSKQQQGESSRPASPALPASPTYSNFGGGPAPIDMMDAMMVDDDDAPPPPRVASSVFHGRTRHRRAGSTTSFSSAFSLPAFLTSSNGGGGGKRPTTPLMSQTQQHMDYHYPQRMRPTSRHGGNGFEQSQEQQPLKVAVPALPMPQRGSGIVYGKPVVVDIDEERRAKRESVVRMQQLQQLQQQEKNGSGSGSNRDSGLGSVRSVSGGHNGMMMGIVMTGGGGGGGR